MKKNVQLAEDDETSTVARGPDLRRLLFWFHSTALTSPRLQNILTLLDHDPRQSRILGRLQGQGGVAQLRLQQTVPVVLPSS